MACHGSPWDDASAQKFGPTTKVDKKRSLESQTFPGLHDDEAKAVEEYARRREKKLWRNPSESWRAAMRSTLTTRT